MSSSSNSETDLLLAHGAWIRNLARKLVADEHRAEDLVQDTWVAALSHRAAAIRSPKSWLAGILSNLVRSDLRGRARRERREIASAHESARELSVPSTEATVETAALGRDLADVVLALDEPFRTTILLRYYEDLPPRVIARRMNVPVRTVNSRLARGLERLRTKLRGRETEDKSWIHVLALLAHSPGFSRAVRDVGRGVALMNAKQVAAIALAVVIAGGAIAWIRSGPDESAVRSLAVDAGGSPSLEAPVAPASPLAAANEDQPAGRTAESSAPTVAESETVEPPAILRKIRGRVLDPDAVPLAGIEVGFMNGGREPFLARAVSGTGGFFELDAASGDGVIRATDPRLVHLSVGKVRTGREVEPLVVVAPGRDLAGRVVDESGAPLTGVVVRAEPPEGFMRRFDAVLDSTERAGNGSTTDVSGAFSLSGSPDFTGVRVVASLDGFETATVPAPAGTDLSILVEMRRRRAEAGEIEGRVVDAEDQRVAGAHVSLGERSAVTDSRGEFRLEIAGAEEAVELVAVHPGHLPGRERAETDAATGKPVWPRDVVVRLGGMPLSISGRVVDGDDKPRPGITLWIDDPTRFGILGEDDVATIESLIGAPNMYGDDFWRSTTTDEDGRFEIGGLLDREYGIGMLDGHTLERRREGPFPAGTRDLQLVFERSPTRKIAGKVLSSRGLPVPGVTLSLYAHTYGGISTAIHTGSRTSDAEGRYAFEGVGGNDLALWVQGDDVVPKMIGVPDATTDQVFDVPVTARCHFKVHVAQGSIQGDSFRVLDADGAELDLMEVGPTGVLTLKRGSLLDGRSNTLGVEDRASTLSILKGGVEVARRELWLAPGTLNVIEI